MNSEIIIRTAKHLKRARYAICLTGAGISTESGIQDFRGPKGLWTLHPEEERKAYKSYDDFIEDPLKWWETILSPAGAGRPGLIDTADVRPNAGHCVLAEMEHMGIIKCLITQNVDALHEKAGTGNLIEYHGSTVKYRCISCGERFRKEAYNPEQLKKNSELPPRCRRCGGIIKSDAVFFGEPIPSDVAAKSLDEVARCDVMLVCGTSAVVFPFAALPRLAQEKGHAMIIEINAEPTPLTWEGVSDYLIQGKTGEILPLILEELKRMDE